MRDLLISLPLPGRSLQELVVRSLAERGQPVWFGCDSGKYIEREAGVWDLDYYSYARTLDTNVGEVNSRGDTAITKVDTADPARNAAEAVAGAAALPGYCFNKRERLLFG